MRAMLYSGIARLLGFVPQVIATGLAISLIIKHFGVDAYATYALVYSIFALIPLNSLGVGGSLTQAIAAYGPEDERSVRTGVTGTRVLVLSGLFVVVVSTIFGLFGLWPSLLGQSSAGNLNLAVTLCIALYGVTFVPMLSQNVLLGVGRNHLAVGIQSFMAAVALALIGILVLIDASSRSVVLVPSLALLVIALVTLVACSRVAHYPWLTILRRAPFRKQFPGIKIRTLSVPLMISSLAIPIAYAGDRIILSHYGTQADLAGYVLVIQIFIPVSTLLQATAAPLWPMMTAARVNGTRPPNLNKVFAAFLGAAVLINVPLVIASPWLARLISGGDIHIGFELPALAAAFTCMSAIAFPLGNSIIDPEGARFVAACAVAAVPIGFTSSILFTIWLGAPGLLISGLIVSVFVQLVPTAIYAFRRLERVEEIAVL